MPAYLSDVARADDVGAELLLDGQVPLHDVGLRVIQGVRAHSAGQLIVDRRDYQPGGAPCGKPPRCAGGATCTLGGV